MAYKIFALWSEPNDPEAFERAYVNHCRIAARVPGQIALVTTRGDERLAHDETPTPFYRVAEQVWDSKADFEACQRSPEWEALLADGHAMQERFENTIVTVVGNPDDSWLQG